MVPIGLVLSYGHYKYVEIPSSQPGYANNAFPSDMSFIPTIQKKNVSQYGHSMLVSLANILHSHSLNEVFRSTCIQNFLAF